MLELLTGVTVGLHIASAHFPDHGYENHNPGVYVVTEDYTLGTYRNSLGRQSLYAGHTLRKGPFALAVGFVSGYSRVEYEGRCRNGLYSAPGAPCVDGFSRLPLTLFLAPSVNVGPVRLWFIPQPEKPIGGVLHLSLEHKF